MKNECDKSVNSVIENIEIQKKHILVSHEIVKLCRYDRNCERNLCMFKHSKKEDEPEHDESDFISDAVETISVSGVDEEDLGDDDEMD